MKKYQEFKAVNEVRRPKQCPILDFTPIIDSEVYKDMLAMGFVEVTKGEYDEIVTVRADVQRSFKDSLGNIGFYHPLLASGSNKPGYPYYNIKFEKYKKDHPDYGLSFLTIKKNIGKSKSNPYPGMSERKSNCIEIEDYFSMMGFLIKLLCQKQGFPISDSELMANESYQDLIKRKMRENPSSIKYLEVVPPSIAKKDALARGSGLAKRLGIFGED